jgi:hypothetical protein
MKRIIVLGLVLFTSLVSAVWAQQLQSPNKPNLQAVKPLVLYDDFNGRRIDPAKWGGGLDCARRYP